MWHLGKLISNSLNYYDVCAQVPNVLHLGSLQRNGAIGAEATKLSARFYLLQIAWIQNVKKSALEFLSSGAFDSV